MGRLLIVRRNSKSKISRAAGLALVCVLILVPASLTVLVQSSTALPDLSDRPPKRTAQRQIPTLLGWLNLPGFIGGSQVRMLGYMLDDQHPVPDGTPVSAFILAPDAGTLLHPAHRFPDETISVSLRKGETIRFAARQLVWTAGVLSYCVGRAWHRDPAYCLTDGTTHPADQADVNRFFDYP